MNSNKITVQSLQIIWSGIFAGALIFALVVIYMSKGNITSFSSEQNFMTSIAAFVALASIAAGYFVSGKLISKIDSSLSAEAKLEQYSRAFIMKLATIEGSALFAIVAFLLQNDSASLMLTGLLLVIMIINFPSGSRIASILSLSEEELSRVKGQMGRK